MSGQPMPASLDVERVRQLAAGSGFTIEAVDEIGSTNVAVRERLGETNGGYVLVAEHQTAGRGRKGRPWIAPAGSALTFTAALPQPVPVGALWAVTFWSALALDDAIAGTTGVRTQLVWPNDVFLAARKVAGILAVSRVAGDRAHVGIGIGINVCRPQHDAGLADIAPPPAFLSDAAPDAEREALLAAILRQLSATVDAFDDPAQIARAWERRAHLAGTRYRYVRDDGRSGDGVAERLGPDGALIVRDAAGSEITLDLADVRITGRA